MSLRARNALVFPMLAAAIAACEATTGTTNPSGNGGPPGQGNNPDQGNNPGNPGGDGGASTKDGSSGIDAGSGGDHDGGVISNGPRSIPPDVLARKAICYSGYRTGQSPETSTYPTADQIKEDLQILMRGGFTFLRLFDCSTFASTTLQVIRDNHFDLKVMEGVWIAGGKANFDTQNQAEIDRCVSLFQNYSDIVVAVSVGNENLDYWSDVHVSSPEMVSYIQEVRGRVTQPVTTDDLYPPFTFQVDSDANYTDVVDVVKALDFISVHIYPFLDAMWDGWDWRQTSTPAGHARAVAMMNAAMSYTKDMLSNVKSAINGKGIDIPILIGESGWKSVVTDANGNHGEPFMAHPVNQKIFYDAMQAWVYGAGKDSSSPPALFFFAPFDEPWKTNDDGWGLFDVNRKAKYAVWDQFPDLKPANAPQYSDNDAVYYK